MDLSFYKTFFFTLVLCCTAFVVSAQADVSIISSDTLRIGIAGSKPFVFAGSNTGISAEIWDQIAKEKSWNYRYVPFSGVNPALDALTAGEIDVVVGPVSITAKRLETMRFSQPFYNSSISIISRVEKATFWDKIKPLFSFKLIIAVGVFLIILSFVGTLFWLAERKKSPEQFPQKPLNGIGTGMWLAVVTMSTTGYGDKAPITVMGRIIAGAWMIISIIFATSMIAGIASVLTVTNNNDTVTNVEQLSGRKAATISGSPSQEFLEKEKVRVSGVNNLEEAMKKLEDKNVDAVVYDRPQLLYFTTENNSENLNISKAEYYKQGYGFAFPINSTIISEVNLSLLKLAENQELEKIIHAYIKKDE